MTVQVSVRLTEEDVASVDELIAVGRFTSRSDALRAGLRGLLRELREQAIEDAYRRGYGEKPQESWIGRFGLAALSACVRAEQRDPL